MNGQIPLWRQVRWGHLGQEAMATLLVMYLVGIAGTLNGLVSVQLEQITFAIIAVGGIWWVSKIVTQPPQRLPSLILPLLSLGGVQILTTLSSMDPRRSLIQVGYWAAVTTGYWMVADMIASKSNRARLERALLATLTALALIGLYQVWAWWRGQDFSLVDVPPRPTSVMGNPNPFAMLLLIASVIVLKRLIQASSWPDRIVAGLWLVLLGIVLVLTGSRSVWLGAGAGAITLVILSLQAAKGKRSWLEAWHRVRSVTWKVWLLGAILLALTLVILAVLIPLARSQALHPAHGSLDHRIAIWQAGWEAFLARPLLGWGPMTVGSRLMESISVPPDTVHAHPHNLILYLAAESGLAGLLALGWTVVVAIRVTWKTGQRGDKQTRQQALVASVFLAAVLTASMTDVTFLPGMSLLTLWAWLILMPDQGHAAIPRWQALLRRIAAPLLIIASLVLWGMQIPGEVAATDGLYAASTGDWQAAARHLERAAQRDPRLVAYTFQAAYANGQAGIGGDRQALSKAIAGYRAALAIEPMYAVHWANLAVLEAYAGQAQQALEHARYAAKLAPGDSVIGGLPDALQGKPFQYYADPKAPSLGLGGSYSWYLFHVPGLDMRVLPPPGWEG